MVDCATAAGRCQMMPDTEAVALSMRVVVTVERHAFGSKTSPQGTVPSRQEARKVALPCVGDD
jgi:hypothetical protein